MTILKGRRANLLLLCPTRLSVFIREPSELPAPSCSVYASHLRWPARKELLQYLEYQQHANRGVGANVTLYTSKRGVRVGVGIRGELLKRSMLVGESSIDSHGCMKGTIKGFFFPSAAGESEPINNQTLATRLMVQ